MNSQIRKVAVLVMVMFLILITAATYIQYFRAPELRADGRNVRTMYNSYERERGKIFAGDGKTVLAASTPTDDAFSFQRTYPGGAKYAPVTGYFATAFNSSTGIERAENEDLSGAATTLAIQRIQDVFANRKARGADVVTTIEPKIQNATWDAMQGLRGGAVVIDVKTGGLLSLVSTPSFDPNLIASNTRKDARTQLQQLEADKSRPMTNRAIAGDLYPPASTFKIVTAAAILRAGLATPDTVISAPDTLALPQTSHKLTNYAGESCGNGNVPLKEAFARSCNTPFAELAMKLGKQKLASEARSFGFEQKTSIPIRVTPSIFSKNLEALSQANTAFSGIGQFDVRATPLQMAMVSQAIANDGKQMQPFLVKSVRNAAGAEIASTRPSLRSTPVPPEVAGQLRQMMNEVVNASYGSGSKAAANGIEVAGKTGTAQAGDHNVVWFTGFAPVSNPKIAFAIAIEGDPGQSLTGGAIAAPIARKIVEAGVR